MSSSLPPTFVEGFHDESKVKRLTYKNVLGTDMLVSNVGMGAAAFGKFYNERVELEEAKEILLTALKSGVNVVDTAPWYGNTRSENFVGKALKGVPRSAYYLCTKIGCYGELDGLITDRFNYNSATALKSFEESLKRLGADYVDILYVHDFDFVYSFNQLIEHTLPALAKLKAAGKVRYVGISSYNLKPARRMVKLAPKGSIDVYMSNNRCYLADQDLLDELDFFRDHGIGVINASPAGSGLLRRNDIPAWHVAPPLLKEAAVKAADYCHERGVNIATLSGKWCYNNPRLTTTLCSITSKHILDASLESASNPLTEDERKLIQEVRAKFFDPLPIWNWENLTTTPYWRLIRQAGMGQHEG